MLVKQQNRIRRHRRVRAKVAGTIRVPRLCVFRSGAHIYAQLIDDSKGQTIAQASDLTGNEKGKRKNEKPPASPAKRGEQLKIKKDKTDKKDSSEDGLAGKVAVAREIGLLLAEKAKEKGISQIVFDRGGFRYQGRVKALADGAREGGLKF